MMTKKFNPIDYQIPGKDEVTRFEKIHNNFMMQIGKLGLKAFKLIKK